MRMMLKGTVCKSGNEMACTEGCIIAYTVDRSTWLEQEMAAESAVCNAMHMMLTGTVRRSGNEMAGRDGFMIARVMGMYMQWQENRQSRNDSKESLQARMTRQSEL